MRGTQIAQAFRIPQFGIIPAHAGNTSPLQQGDCQTRDHPRACGEHTVSVMFADAKPGSSPRMRGTHDNFTDSVAQMGIIPAHAGNTSLIRHYEQNLGDHPRACGEHWLAARRVERRAGSSPRMRGTPLHDLVFRCQRGIIPAHAGNTSIGRSKFRSSWDHPRACGEHP